MQPCSNTPGVRVSARLVARRHVDLLRVNSALCSRVSQYSYNYSR
ncbi:putative leader peptide [Actinospica sp.]|nr:putative leader peptide [Actinospica sp.]